MSDDSATHVAVADAVSEVMYAAAGLLLGVLGAAAVVVGAASLLDTGNVAPAVALLALGSLSLLGGVAVQPGTRRRLARRGPVTSFGTVPSVDEGTFREGDVTAGACVVCGRRTEEGLVRRSREEVTVAGVPLYTTAERTNHYCPACASEELGLDHGPDGTRPGPDTGEDATAAPASEVEAE